MQNQYLNFLIIALIEYYTIYKSNYLMYLNIFSVNIYFNFKVTVMTLCHYPSDIKRT